MRIYFSGGQRETIHVEKIGGQNNMMSYYYILEALMIKRKKGGSLSKRDSFYRNVNLKRKGRK